MISTSSQPHVTRRAFAGTLAVMATALAWPVSAQTPAASPQPTEAPRFFIHPLDETAQGYPDLTLEPGESATLNVGVTVQGEVATELTIYRADTIPATGGGFAAAELDHEPTGQTLWMDIEPTTFQGEPGSTYEFPIPVTMPEDAAPGQYITALVVQTNPLEISGSSAFDQIIRSALSVVINVPGEITPGMEVGEPEIVHQSGLRFLRIPIRNTGNILIRPEGSVTMTTPAGDEVITARVELKAIYLGLDNEIRIRIPDQVPDGDYLVSFDLHETTHGLDAVMEDVPVTLAQPEGESTPEAEPFVIESASVTPNGDPVQFADVAISITNRGSTIPTARITLVAMRDGEEVETYDVAQNQAILQGGYDFSTRYIPATGWESGTWTFRLTITAVDASGTETTLAEVDIEDEIVIP